MMHLVGHGLIDRTVVILCGGKGTRSANPNLPKALQEINGKSLLSMQLAALKPNSRYEIIFIAGWQGDKLVPEIENEMKKYPLASWKTIIEKFPEGTTKALKESIEIITSEEIMVILGDLYIKADLGIYFDIWKRMKSDVLFIAHPNNHPHDSDLVLYELNSLTVKKFKSKRRIPANSDGNMALAGISLIKIDVLKKLSYEESDWVDSIFSLKNPKISIKVLPVIDEIMDIGNPSRLAEAHKIDIAKNYQKFSALLLDLDGTLTINHEVKSAATKLVFDERIIKSLAKFSQENIPIFIISNQPGLAKGFFSWDDFDSYRTHIESYLVQHNIKISRWFICPHHPDSGFEGEVSELKIHCDCRKPGIKFAKDIVELYKVNLQDSYFLGDSESDSIFAKKAGIKFLKVTLDTDLCNSDILSTWDALDLLASSL
jgi:mannose-1-phosphate guanylyltransferase / phosphomannomutase